MSNKNQETYNYIFYNENVLRDTFWKADTDRSGFLDFSEFSRLLEKYDFDMLTNYELERSFANHDLNHDNRVSVDEYIKYVKNCNNYQKLIEEFTQMFRDLDQNNNGYVTASEVKQDWSEKGVNLSDSAVLDVIKAFDMDGDKQITLNEYLDILTTKHIKYKE